MRILFSESENYYRRLGLKDNKNHDFYFDGMKHYKLSESKLDCLFDAYVCFMYTMPHNYILTKKFNSLGKPTILVMDGLYDYANATKNTMVTKYGVELYNPILQNSLISVGGFPASFLNEGINVIQYNPEHMIKLVEKEIKLPTDSHFLLTTANSAYFDEIELDSLLSILKITIDCLKYNNVSFDIRIYDDVLLGMLLPYLPENTRNINYGKFEEVIANYTHVITTPSSIVISSMYYGRAVAMLNYRDTPLSFSSAWVFSSKETIDMGFPSFKESNSQRILMQKKILQYEISKNNINDALNDALYRDTFNLASIENCNLENIMLNNMLNSKFNINVEYFFRKLYLKYKNTSFFRRIRGSIK